jgi:hypothetical protein
MDIINSTMPSVIEENAKSRLEKMSRTTWDRRDIFLTALDHPASLSTCYEQSLTQFDIVSSCGLCSLRMTGGENFYKEPRSTGSAKKGDSFNSTPQEE